jgi:maltooligosyltrehalose trehalohydrolase
MTWSPSIGAWPDGEAFRFRIWAAGRTDVELLITSEGIPSRRVVMTAAGDGTFTAHVSGLDTTVRYGYLLDDEGPFPDPASRYQPDGVHGLSALDDPHGFPWTDQAWTGIALERAVFYELHVGTFSPAGTLAGASDRLADLADLGITVVELMPIAGFPGSRNWGYDGVSLFAPAPAYGTPDDLRRFVDRAHALGLAVVLDVVYNHFGPDGAYAFTFSPFYRSDRHDSPWGCAVNFDGAHAEHVREFVVENALHWVHEYHVDGFRLDATHAIVDGSPRHVLAELADRARASAGSRTLLFVAEDDRNLTSIVEPTSAGGWGFDAVWADDFHHHVRRRAAGDRDGHYEDYSDRVADLVDTLNAGWFYRGQHSAFRAAPRGSDPAGILRERMIVCLQNHDQIGNRAFGERLNHQVHLSLFRALTVVLLAAPETPLIFMGQEWAALTPFLYFTDHHAELGRLVTEGRRREFSRFDVFRDPEARSRIPDPQSHTTFDRSRLDWDERARAPHAGILTLHRALLALRRSHAAMRTSADARAMALDDDTIAIHRGGAGGAALVAVARLRGGGSVPLDFGPDTIPRREWSVILNTEDAAFTGTDGEAARPNVRSDAGASVVTFAGPSALVLSS